MILKNKSEIITYATILIVIFSFIILFYNNIKSFFEIFLSSYGLLALFILVFIMDFMIQPISPDLIVFGATLSGSNIIITSLIGGLASFLAGIAGYYAGAYIGHKKFESWFGKKHLDKGNNFYKKFGKLTVIIGALSPVPFSLICWTSGIYNMNKTMFVITSLATRIPRFLLMGYFGSLL